MNNNIFPDLFHHQSYKLHNQNTVRYRALQRAIQFHSTLASCSSALIFIITFSSDFLQVRDLMHENINQYIGMCVESPNVCIVSMFCSRGSLQVTDIKFKLSYVLFLYSDTTFVNPTIIGWKLNWRKKKNSKYQEEVTSREASQIVLRFTSAIFVNLLHT